MENGESDKSQPPIQNTEETQNERKGPRVAPRIIKFLRRIHLYAGLFLLPWVFLYGVTGAMFNHQELFPAGK